MTEGAKGPITTGDHRLAGGCEVEGCRDYAMVFVNGRRLLCWDHYCAEVKSEMPDRSEPKQPQAPALIQIIRAATDEDLCRNGYHGKGIRKMADSINIAAGRQAVALAKQEWGPSALEPYLSALVAVPDRVCTVIGKWFAISVEPRQHGLAKGEIAERGLVPYLPMIPNRERHGRGAQRTTYRPMFGPYMFVKCALTAENFGLVKSSRGVKRFLGADTQPEPVDEGRIDIIRLIEADMQSREDRRALIEQAAKVAKEKGRSGIVWHFSEGDRVKIKHGPFASFYARLESAVDEHDRIKALISILGGPSRVTLSAFDLEAP